MKVVIVGAGPSGLFLAHRLLNRNSDYRIHIFERKKNPNNLEYADRREFGFGLGAKAKNWLKTVDQLWELVIEKGVKLSFGELILIPRRELCALLLDLLISNYQENTESEKAKLKTEFNTSVLEVDFQNHKILVERKKSCEWVSYDLLVGADGVNSTIRSAMLASFPKEINFQQQIRPQVWKVLQLPKQPDLPSQYATRLIRLEKQSSEFGLHFGAILPRKDGYFSALMFWKPVGEVNAINPYGVDTVEKLEQLWQEMLPKNNLLIKLDFNAAETFLKTKPSHEYWSKCDYYHNIEGQVVLIGDAAHNMFSILGQGCTAALADVMVLDELLQKHQNDLSVVLPKFSEQQVREGHAASDLNLIALVVYHPWFRKLYKIVTIFWVAIFKQSSIFERINQIDAKYERVAHENSFWIWLAKRLLTPRALP